MLEQEKISRIKILLKAHPKGLTITDISAKLKMNRNSAAKYLEILQISGQVESKSYGTAKVFFLTHRLPISALVSIASDLVITLDENYRILFVNDGFCTLFAIKKEDATGSHVVDIFRAGFGKDVLPDVFSDLIADQEKVREVRLTRDEGDLFFKIRSMKTVFDDGSRGITITMEDITREKKDQIELEAKESRYRGIVEDQTEFIIRFLADHTLTFVNASYCHILNRKPEDLLGTLFPDSILQRDRSVFNRCLLALSRENPSGSFECRLAVQKGGSLWVSWTLRAMFGEGKKAVEYQAVGHDITGNKEADDKIRQYITQMEFFSNELQHFIELSPGDNIYDAICSGLAKILPEAAISVSSFDPATTTLTVRAFANRKDHDHISRFLGRQLTGMKVRIGETSPPDRFFSGKVYNTRKNLHEIFFKQVPAETCAEIEDALNLGEIYAVGLMWKKELLGNITFSLRKGRYLRNESCVEAYVRAASISLKKAIAENALRESENLYRTVIENIQDVFYRADTEGNLIMASPSWASLLGYSSVDECIGMKMVDFHWEPEKRTHFLAGIAQNGNVRDYETVLKRKDGTPVPIATNSHIYSDKNGVILGIEGIIHDISERKAAEARVNEYISEMEFLSQKLLDFIVMDPAENVYDKIVSDLKSLIPGAMILVNSFDPKSGLLKVQSAAMSGQQRDAVTRVLGKDVTGSEFLVDAAGAAAFRTGTLQAADIPLYEIVFRSIPEPACVRLEAELGIGSKHVIGFVRGDEILGNAGIFLMPGGKIQDPRLVEMYSREAAIALQRLSAEEARRKSDEIFYNIAQNSPFPIALIEQDGSYQYINENFTRLFGYTLGDFHSGKELFRLVFPDPDYRRQVIAIWKADQDQAGCGHCILRTFSVRCKDSSQKEIIFRKVTLSDGKICIICEDITERNAAERTHRLLSSIIASTSDAVIAKGKDGTVISWNRAAEHLYGYSGQEMIGNNIARIIPADRLGEMERIHNRIEAGESVSNLETRRIRKDGREIDVSVTISPITSESGEVVGASTIARDITPYKAEERLRENEKQYRSLVENISVGIYRSTGDPTGRFVWGNSSLVHILGYPSLEELRDVGISELFVEHDGRNRLLNDLKSEGFVKNRELALRRPDGEIVTVLVTALARFDPGGELSCINGIVEDISRRRMAENRMQILDKQLQDILGFIRDPVVIVDRAQCVAAWNMAMEQLTGVREADVIGSHDFHHLLPFNDPSRPPLFSFFDSDHDKLTRYYPGAIRDGSAIIAQVRDMTHRGGFYTLRVSPLLDPRGDRIGAIQIVQAALPESMNYTPVPMDPAVSPPE